MKKASALILSLFMIAAMVGCSDKGKSKDEIAQTTTVTTIETSASTSSGKFNWDTAMNETYLDGVKIKMPFSLNDLGKGYMTGTVIDRIYNESGCSTSLYKVDYYDEELKKNVGERIGFVSFDYISAEEYSDDCVVGSISNMQGLSIQGIEKGVPMELVYNTLGEPKVNDKVAIYYGDDTTKKIHIYKTDDNCVSHINIDFNEES